MKKGGRWERPGSKAKGPDRPHAEHHTRAPPGPQPSHQRLLHPPWKPERYLPLVLKPDSWVLDLGEGRRLGWGEPMPLWARRSHSWMAWDRVWPQALLRAFSLIFINPLSVLALGAGRKPQPRL